MHVVVFLGNLGGIMSELQWVVLSVGTGSLLMQL